MEIYSIPTFAHLSSGEPVVVSHYHKWKTSKHIEVIEKVSSILNNTVAVVDIHITTDGIFWTRRLSSADNLECEIKKRRK